MRKLPEVQDDLMLASRACMRQLLPMDYIVDVHVPCVVLFASQGEGRALGERGEQGEGGALGEGGESCIETRRHVVKHISLQRPPTIS